MLDFKEEQMLSMREASEWLAERNIKVSHITVRNWVHQGLQGVNLEHLKIGGVLLTSVEAIERFVARTNGEDATVITNKKREREREESYQKACDLFGVPKERRHDFSGQASGQFGASRTAK